MKVLTRIASSSMLVIGLTAPAAFAKNAEHMQSDRGTISNINTDNSTLMITEAKSHQPQTFSYNHDTEFREQDHVWSKSKPVAADQLREGEHAKVRYEKQNDQLMAKSVVVSHTK